MAAITPPTLPSPTNTATQFGSPASTIWRLHASSVRKRHVDAGEPLANSSFISPFKAPRTPPLMVEEEKKSEMGICSFCEATSVATAKLILQDGQLQKFPYPVKVSQVLQKSPTCFICNSDEMDFDDFISAISEEEELQPGQLYFALPLSRLNHPLQAQEMAALAVKASLALAKSSGGDICGCSRNGVVPAAFSGRRAVRPLQGLGSGTGLGGDELLMDRRRRLAFS